MAWEKRGGGSYYYRKTRKGGRVRSKYMGKGVLGQICAKNDQDEQRERKAKRDAHHAARQAEEEIDRQLADAESAVATITAAVLYACGYHRHKGQWRKKRHGQKSGLKEDRANTSRRDAGASEGDDAGRGSR